MTFLKKSVPRENSHIEMLRDELKNGSKFVKFSMNIPRSLHLEFRKKAFLDDKDMKDILTEAIRTYMNT